MKTKTTSEKIWEEITKPVQRRVYLYPIIFFIFLAPFLDAFTTWLCNVYKPFTTIEANITWITYSLEGTYVFNEFIKVIVIPLLFSMALLYAYKYFPRLTLIAGLYVCAIFFIMYIPTAMNNFFLWPVVI